MSEGKNKIELRTMSSNEKKTSKTVHTYTCPNLNYKTFRKP